MQVDILAFGAHPDDVELAASGTLIKEIQSGKSAVIVDLTRGELGSRGTAETRKAESIEANKILGITARENLDMGDGFFTHSEENLLKIIRVIREFRPRLVLCNAISDRHPDHGKASKLVSEACFLSGLLKIETEMDGKPQKHHRPQAVYHYIQDRYIKPDFVVDVSDQLSLKFDAIRAYKTQFFDPENLDEPKTPISGEDFFDFLKARGAEFGRAIGSAYAEGFTVERFPGVESLFDLR